MTIYAILQGQGTDLILYEEANEPKRYYVYTDYLKAYARLQQLKMVGVPNLHIREFDRRQFRHSD